VARSRMDSNWFYRAWMRRKDKRERSLQGKMKLRILKHLDRRRRDLVGHLARLENFGGPAEQKIFLSGQIAALKEAIVYVEGR